MKADGEFQASEQITKAAGVLSAEPGALQLRYLQTVSQIATERTSVVLFPIPIDLFSAFINKGKEKKS